MFQQFQSPDRFVALLDASHPPRLTRNFQPAIVGTVLFIYNAAAPVVIGWLLSIADPTADLQSQPRPSAKDATLVLAAPICIGE